MCKGIKSFYSSSNFVTVCTLYHFMYIIDIFKWDSISSISNTFISQSHFRFLLILLWCQAVRWTIPCQIFHGLINSYLMINPLGNENVKISSVLAPKAFLSYRILRSCFLHIVNQIVGTLLIPMRGFQSYLCSVSDFEFPVQFDFHKSHLVQHWMKGKCQS